MQKYLKYNGKDKTLSPYKILMQGVVYEVAEIRNEKVKLKNFDEDFELSHFENVIAKQAYSLKLPEVGKELIFYFSGRKYVGKVKKVEQIDRNNFIVLITQSLLALQVNNTTDSSPF